MSNAATKPAAATSNARLWRIRVAIALSGVAAFSQLYLFQPLLADLGAQFGLSPAASSFAISGGTLGMAGGLLVFAFAADALSRRRLMATSLFASALLTIGSALAPSFAVLVAVNVLKGVVLAGVSAVAMAYLYEEMPAAALGLATSLYLSGNTFGGMSGRVAAGLLSAGGMAWPAITAVSGAASLLLAGVFAFTLPASRHFTPRPVHVRRKLLLMSAFLRRPPLVALFGVAALMMGAFVSVYNYLDFRLSAPPFSLPRSAVASVFLMYLVGIAGSLLAGRWSDRHSPTRLLKAMIATFAAGVLMLLTTSLVLTVAGVGVLTFGFFGAHTMASRLVSERAPVGTSSAVSLYWLFYYVGSTVLGSATGVVLSRWSWGAFVALLAALAAGALALAFAGDGGQPEAVAE